MAEPSLIQAISLLTKVSSDTNKRLKALEKDKRGPMRGGKGLSLGKTEPRDIVEDAKPVIITDFGPTAEEDLANALGRQTGAALETQEKKNKSNLMNILKLLGIGGALLALANGQGILGLVTGFLKVFDKVKTFAKKTGAIVAKIGKTIWKAAKGFAKMVWRMGKRVGKVIGKIAKTAGRIVGKVGKQIGKFAGKAMLQVKTLSVRSVQRLVALQMIC